MNSLARKLFLIIAIAWVFPVVARAESNPCSRPAQGSVIASPPNLYSRKGLLRVDMTYNTSTDAIGRTLYCFATADGKESPTLHVRPGDRVIINLKNNLPNPSGIVPLKMPEGTIGVCGDAFMTPTAVNMHFHGTSLAPTCHSDEVIHTLVGAGSSFKYDFRIPADQPPGLYWYHPHVHGLSDQAVLGGASGAIVVDGIESAEPATSKLPQQVLIVRDQYLTRPVDPNDPNQPSWDLSLNYVPISYPDYTPAIIMMAPNERQLWRVLNASADAIVDLQLQYDGRPQTLQVVALDGVALNSHNGMRRGSMLNMNHVYLGPASRAEFIVTAPSSEVKEATLVTLGADTGPNGDITPPHRMATVKLTGNRAMYSHSVEDAALRSASGVRRVYNDDLVKVTPNTTRHLFFSETPPTPGEGDDSQTFFITVAGEAPTAFDPAAPPAIITTRGVVEDWTIENRTLEVHEFHIHQIHFLLMARNGVAVPPEQQQYMDEATIPYYSGAGPFPNVTVRMDFRGPLVGDFLYHCHILDHEDNGMMAMLRVEPSARAAMLDRIRFALGSVVRWFRPTEAAASTSAWCVRGRPSAGPRGELRRRKWKRAHLDAPAS
jgi:FtsP/CotA-like multicopper oxidase with cupredoxin domain